MIHPRVQTTSRESFEKPGRSHWLDYREGRSCNDPKCLYVFTDGSSLGSYAAVFVTVERDGLKTLERVKWSPPTSTRNMGAEWRGLVLALSHAPSDARLVVVSDLLWIGATLVGARQVRDAELVALATEAKALIAECGLDVTFVHHEGHQEDESHFTRFNAMSDELCKEEAKKHRKEQG